MTEEWKHIPGYDGYEASNLGRIRSYLGRGGKKCYRVSVPRVLKGNVGGRGYPKVNILLNGRRVTVSIHRLIASAFVPGYEPGLIVCHNNSVKTDNRAENLRWDTTSSNSIDASKLGDLPRQMLDIERVKEIRSLYETGEHSHRSLAAMFGVTHQAIRDLLIRKNYRWVA